ncbi:hypothetical protein F5Y17DRAFT_460074 [Xylariaceae sp. FL0594]|nr:hypothetical protein F5Y17DRAFT_460074 [Xylariaceae sp. FL0594]
MSSSRSSKRGRPGEVGRRSPSQSPPIASGSKSSSCSSKSNIRVSLACVQCRSKHMRCDASQPACGRCSMEGKPCYYAKSRRGIRDPLKRSLISDNTPPPLLHPFNPSAERPPGAQTVPNEVGKNLSNGWTRTKKPVNMPLANESLLEPFYEHFYHAHSIITPKAHFLTCVALDPSPYSFLLTVLSFCEALYAQDCRLPNLRETAYSAACGSLPYTVQSVQGLHILSIMAFGEMRYSHGLGFANQAWTIAIEIGMHQKAFADRAPDSILAESYRRTWWHVKFQGITQHLRDGGQAISYRHVESDVEIPCSEEWEFESGEIRQPISVLQYEREVTLGRSDFSSTALQIELGRIEADIAATCRDIDGESEVTEDLINRADSTLCDFIRRIPQWKMEVVDPDGRADQVLFGALALAHISRIRLRQPASRKGLNIRDYFPLGPSDGPNRKGQVVKLFGWNPHSVEIQAANKVCDLFRYPIPVKSMRPTMIPGLLSVAIVYLDACVFRGLDSPLFRERLNSLIRILRLHGEIWPLSKKAAEEVQAIADEYLTPSDIQSSSSGSVSGRWNSFTVDGAAPASSIFDPLSDPNLVQGWLSAYDLSDPLLGSTGICWPMDL